MQDTIWGMLDPRITKLRHARARINRVLERLEPVIAGYREKLAGIEAEIQAIAPELKPPPRRYKPNADFARAGSRWTSSAPHKVRQPCGRLPSAPWHGKASRYQIGGL